MTDTARNLETQRKVAEWSRIGDIAVRKAQEESRRMGVPNVYSIDGQIVYELPNGERVTELPPEYVAQEEAALAPHLRRHGQSSQ